MRSPAVRRWVRGQITKLQASRESQQNTSRATNKTTLSPDDALSVQRSPRSPSRPPPQAQAPRHHTSHRQSLPPASRCRRQPSPPAHHHPARQANASASTRLSKGLRMIDLLIFACHVTLLQIIRNYVTHHRIGTWLTHHSAKPLISLA